MNIKSDRRIAVFAVLIAAALLAGLTFLVARFHSQDSELSGGDNQFYGDAVLQEILIKGCLFDLGIDKAAIAVEGLTIRVSVKDEIEELGVDSAFEPIKGIAQVNPLEDKTTRILFGETTWAVLWQAPADKNAQVAIIVDDIGLDLKMAMRFSAIDADLTFSILPMRPYSIKTAEYLHGLGKEIMLHLPMEGNGKNPGEGAILLNMCPVEVSAVLISDLEKVPYISGVNNHMGSRVTPDKTIMTIIHKELKKRGLFFIDSLTTSRSVCSEVAGDVGIRFNARDIFFDNERSYSYIKGQLDKLVAIARAYPDAIGICHPYPVTLEVLSKELPGLKDRGVEVVRVSSFVQD